MVNEDAIKQKISSRPLESEVEYVREEWFTPSGRERNTPMWVAGITNRYLDKHRELKASDEHQLRRKAEDQLRKWREQEIRARVKAAHEDHKERARMEAEDLDRATRETQEALQGLLAATLDVDDRIDWNALVDRRPPPAFTFNEAPPEQPPFPDPPKIPPKPFWRWLIPSLERKWQTTCEALKAQYHAQVAEVRQRHAQAVRSWEARRHAAWDKHQQDVARFQQKQRAHNEQLASFKQRFEAGDPKHIEEYLSNVFERSSYPDCVFLEYRVAYDASSQTAVVDVELPPPDAVPKTTGYKYVPSKREAKAIEMKQKEHDALYDSVIKQIALRTLHEVFESIYTAHVQGAVFNGWVTRVDAATGHDQRNCVISVSAGREEFEAFNLARVDPNETIKKLKGLTAGPLSEVAPVKPIMQFDRDDARFVDHKEVLDEISGESNLAEMPWEDFEHLVRELCGKMFSTDGAEVRVTQASRDQGVDAIAFDPDPIRGGKFVIQAKRYTKVVPVSAVRDLYGTMLNEGAAKGILVTTAHYGREARAFCKNKPITLIDGANLVYLLEQHGYRVRIDVKAARSASAEATAE